MGGTNQSAVFQAVGVLLQHALHRCAIGHKYGLKRAPVAAVGRGHEIGATATGLKAFLPQIYVSCKRATAHQPAARCAVVGSRGNGQRYGFTPRATAIAAATVGHPGIVGILVLRRALPHAVKRALKLGHDHAVGIVVGPLGGAENGVGLNLGSLNHQACEETQQKYGIRFSCHYVILMLRWVQNYDFKSTFQK